MSKVSGVLTRSLSTARLKGSRKRRNFLILRCNEEGARPTTPGKRWEKNLERSWRKERWLSMPRSCWNTYRLKGGLHQEAPIKHASRAYRTRVAPRAAVRPPLLFEQRLDDRPLVGQVHARLVRRVERNHYEKTSKLTLIGGTLT
jgi:hypothetical protein